MAVAAEALAAPVHHERRPGRLGIAARAVVALLIVVAVLLLPLVANETWNRRISLAAIFAIIGLSVNIITGHAGQISLGHQAFVGIGAFMSAFVVSRIGLSFYLAVPIAGVMGGVMALVLGLVALRIRGLYLALITLAFGLMAETTIFNWRDFTGGGAGAEAPRPAGFESERAFAYLCFILVAIFVFIDWRLVKTKAGRAIVALRNDERVAATLGVNVTAYKLLGFVSGGVLAGVAGSLFAHRNQFVQALDFSLQTALVWILMAVVGGLGSRAGVVIGSAFFAIFPFLLPSTSFRLPLIGDVIVQILTPLIGAFLLVLTLTLYPGGIGQQLLPLRRWLAGGHFLEHRRGRTVGVPAAIAESPGTVAPAEGDGAKEEAGAVASKAAPKKATSRKPTQARRKT